MTAARYEDERYEEWLDDDADPDGRLRLVFTGGRLHYTEDLPDIALYVPPES